MVVSGSVLPFATRLRDLLATLESAALLGAAEGRVRGLGEHLRFACLAIGCAEALVALETDALGRLIVPAVADAGSWRPTEHELLPGGTPFAFLLAGGGGHAVQLGPADPMVAPLRAVLAADPAGGVFVPIRLGESVVGGVALFVHDGTLSDRELEMGERLAAVLALTVESFRTERILFELFARALPDLLAPDSATSLARELDRHVHGLRVAPAYRRRLALATVLGRIAEHGSAEAALAEDLVRRLERYLSDLVRPAEAR